MRGRIAILMVAATAAALACQRQTAPPPVEVARTLSPVVVYSDNAGGIQDSVRLVIRDRTTLERVWREATATQERPPPVPAADFEHDMFVLVAAGRMTLEDRISVHGATVQPTRDARGRRDDRLEVAVQITQGCGRFQRDAYPLEIVRLERFDGRVEFLVRRERDQTC
jgi:hypothetical protein